MTGQVTPSGRIAPAVADSRTIARRLAHVRSVVVVRHHLHDEARRTAAARRAALSRLEDVLRDPPDDVDDRLQCIFRDHVGATVRAVSPLVLDACVAEALDLDAAMEGVRHDGDRHGWLGGPASMRNLASLVRQMATPGVPTSFELLSRFQRCGFVVREQHEPLGALGFRIGKACIEIGVVTPRAKINSSNGRVCLTLDGPVPETLRLAALGRRIDDLVEHPLLSGRGYRVVLARPDRAGRTLFVMRADPVPWTMPWVRGAST